MSIKTSLTGLAAGLGAIASTPALAVIPFTVTLETEAPGIQTSQSGFHAVGVENFDARAVATNQSFTTNFGGSAFTGTYTGVQVRNRDQYGGAGGTGRYAVTFTNAGYTLDLATSDPGGVTYFGFWLSALDLGNNVSFYKGGQLLFTFSSTDARNFINSLPNHSAYYCNPNAAFANRNCGQPYTFLNFYARGGATFDRIHFSENPQVGGYESDNHTVGQWNRTSGTVIPIPGTFLDVPEPGAWAMLIIGFGLVGTAARRRSPVVAA
jgi:hypothetical protein